MKKQSLSGVWNYRRGRGKWEKREVPFSALAVRHSECERTFDLEYSAPRVELKLEGITYKATVILNGVTLGKMLPYSEYTFDITDIVKEEKNALCVLLEDISPTFGPVAGWENFGGIIRDVYIYYKNEEEISDVFFYTELKNDYRDSVCTLELFGKCTDGATYEITLADGENVIYKSEIDAKTEKYSFEVKNVKLWSPDTSKLYDLQIKLLKNGEIRDTYATKVGIREIKCERHRFLLNGKPIFLRGVCKHEMVGDSGHVVSEELIRRDLKIIKELGCNFVRLVHYPHAKRTLEIADELGIMVSEEPGLWWSDTSNPEIAEGSIEVLRRTILRDRNHPSVAFWLCFNECRFTEEFLVESAKMCKATDPTRLVSGANCMSNEETLKYYNICGFDFYTMHPYSQSFDMSREAAKILTDKPLVFTEWGGHYVYDNPKLMREFIYEMRRLYEKNSDGAALAGAFLWCFAEVNDFNRECPAVIDGRLLEGLVDYERNPRMCYTVFKNAWDEDMCPVEYKYNVCGKLPDKLLPLAYKCGGTDYQRLAEEYFLIPKPSFFTEQRPRRIKVGPVCETVPNEAIRKTPLALYPNDLIEFSCGFDCDGIIILGGTDVLAGYPLGEYGDTVAMLTVVFASGEKREYKLRGGIEITTSFATYRSSRIDPVADKAPRFMEFSYDGSFERYVMNKITLPFEKRERVISVGIAGEAGHITLTYALFGYEK